MNSPLAIVEVAPSGPASERRPLVRVVLSFRTSCVVSTRATVGSPESQRTAGVGAVSVPPSMSVSSTPDAAARVAPSAAVSALAGSASMGTTRPMPSSAEAASAMTEVVRGRSVIGGPPRRTR
ncbi:hypothetical protein DEJ12_09200 [Curtobacterium sp. MCLR17_059]|nr:hypothetical protein DEJ12_09200 [Curtobacterium sp. MCLR17_059]PZF49630.1 hypothetical protein DEJ10_12485 [Curtobacterium sp. MCLR17_057]